MSMIYRQCLAHRSIETFSVGARLPRGAPAAPFAYTEILNMNRVVMCQVQYFPSFFIHL